MADTEYARHRERLLELHEKATQSFDRAIMALSGGALAVSIAFIHDVARDPRHTWVVGLAWVSFAASLLAILGSFLTSEAAIVKMIGQIDAAAEEIERGRVTDWLNRFAAGAFVIGTILLVAFAWLNV
jgi:hypothetical protein